MYLDTYCGRYNPGLVYYDSLVIPKNSSTFWKINLLTLFPRVT